MACYYAKLTESNEVLSVLRFDKEDEPLAIQELTKINNWPLWKKGDKRTIHGVCYNDDLITPADDQTKVFRGTYPCLGYTYDPANNIFVEPKPYPSWILNTSTGKYEAPVSRPRHSDAEGDNTESAVVWNEDTGAWDILE